MLTDVLRVIFFNALLSVSKVLLTLFLTPLWPVCMENNTVKEKVAYPSTSLGKIMWKDKLLKAKLLMIEFLVSKHKTTILCQFFLLVLSYPRLHLYNQV